MWHQPKYFTQYDYLVCVRNCLCRRQADLCGKEIDHVQICRLCIGDAHLELFHSLISRCLIVVVSKDIDISLGEPSSTGSREAAKYILALDISKPTALEVRQYTLDRLYQIKIRVPSSGPHQVYSSQYRTTAVDLLEDRCHRPDVHFHQSDGGDFVILESSKQFLGSLPEYIPVRERGVCDVTDLAEKCSRVWDTVEPNLVELRFIQSLQMQKLLRTQVVRNVPLAVRFCPVPV